MDVRQLILDCLDRHENPLRSRKTVMHASKGDMTHPYHPQAFYADNLSIMVTGLEKHGISIVPIHIGGYPIPKFTEEYGQSAWYTFFTMHHWEFEHWRQSYGFQVFTGKPSGDWTDLDFEVESVKHHPYETMACLERLCDLTDTPLVTISKSGGIRFSCRTPGYVRPRNDMQYAAEYDPKNLDEHGNPIRLNLFLEIFGDKSLSRWDARYEIVSGTLLSPPVIDYQSLLDAITPFRDEVQVDPPKRKKPKKRKAQQSKSEPDQKLQVSGSYNLNNLPKDLQWRRVDPDDPKLGLKSKRSDYKCTMTKHRKSQGSVQFYKDPKGVVKIFCHNCRKNITIGSYHQSERESIAEMIANAPPYEEVPSKEEQRQNMVRRIRSGKESHTALRRPPPVLFQTEDSATYSTLEINDEEILAAFEKDKSIILINSETGAGKNYQMENYVLKGGKVIKTTPTTPLAVADEERMRERGINVFHWKARHYLWDLQEERTLDQLLLDPFGNGAVCIDAVRCNKLFAKGGQARKSICPYCDVRDICIERGYLSQEAEASVADVVVIAMQDLFFNPARAGFASNLIKFKELGEELDDDGELEWDEIDRIGVLDEGKAHTFYQKCLLTKSQLQLWRDMWKDTELGEFSIKLIEILEVETGGFSIEKLRAYIKSIVSDAEAIYGQMRKMRLEAEFFKLERPLGDIEDGKILSESAMRFKDTGVEVYIAKDEEAYETLWADKDIPCLPPKAYKAIEMIEMSLDEALRFEVHSVETEGDIDKLPQLAGEWTPLHQFQDVFEHYKLDENTPMKYHDDTLEWYVPPVLLPSLERLVIMGASLNIEHAMRTFQVNKSDIESVFTKPTPYKEGNHVFQIRTGAYPRGSLMEPEEYEKNKWRWVGLKDAGEKFLGYIRSCIEEEKSQHAVITFKQIVEWQGEEWMSSYGLDEANDIYGEKTQNLRFFGHFGKMEGLSKVFDDVNDLWIMGLPEIEEHVLQHNAKMVFGADDEPLTWERSETREFVDVRVQSIYESIVLALVEQAVGRARLNRFRKKRVYLFTGVRIKSITDRKETLLFDFADCEIATSLSELKEVILKRQAEEQAEIAIEDTVEMLLLKGESGYSIIQQGIAPSHIVNRMVSELRPELEDLRKQQDVELTKIAKTLSGQGKSVSEISDELNKSRSWVRPRVKI